MGENDWKSEWVGMPEFVQEKQQPHQTINIRFETEQDVAEFARLIGQNITPKTKSLWFPKKPEKKERKVYES